MKTRQAVAIVKNINLDDLPDIMYKNGIVIKNEDMVKAFADQFTDKVSLATLNAMIDPQIYNGRPKRVVT